MRIRLLLATVIVSVLSVSAYATETISVYSTQSQADKPDKPGESSKAFVLFYMSSCPHCRRFDPILKHYAKTHHIPVLAYTLDGQSLPSFPNSVVPNRSEMQKFFPKHNPVVPTVFMVDLRRHKIIPLLQGEAREDQLALRIHQLYGDDAL